MRGAYGLESSWSGARCCSKCDNAQLSQRALAHGTDTCSIHSSQNYDLL